MAMKLPNLPQKDGIQKASGVIQFVLFLALFLGIYLPLRQVVHSTFLRILILVADYAVTAIVLFLFIKPMMAKLENKLRK